MCDGLLCLAVGLSIPARHLAGEILGIVMPIAAFVALSLEHSVANMVFLPLALVAAAPGVSVAGIIGNLVPVTLGNIVGGVVLVGLKCWLCYRPGRVTEKAVGQAGEAKD